MTHRKTPPWLLLKPLAGKRLLWGGVAALSMAGAVLYAADAWQEPAAPEYITAEARAVEFEQSVLANGVVEPARLVNVGARASGQVVRLHVKVGDTVRAGQLITEIDAQPQRNSLRTAQAARAAIQAQWLARQVALQQAEKAHVRQARMRSLDATSQEALEAAQAMRDSLSAEVAALAAQVRQAEVAVDTARTELGYTRITAPIDGVVVAVVTEEGRTVNAFQSVPTIVTLAQLRTMKVRAEISEADITRIRPGQEVEFSVLGEPDKLHHARLASVDPAPSSIGTKVAADNGAPPTPAAAAVYYNALFEMPNPSGELRPSMTAQVRILVARRSGVLAIPMTALGERQEDGAYLVRTLEADGQARTRRVRVGMNNKVLVEVLDGLQAGQQVIVGDGALATPGGATPDV